MAKALADNGHDVTIWAREPELAAAINERHANEAYLPGVALPARLRASTEPLDAANGSEALFIAVPSPFMLQAVKRVLTSPDIMEGRTLVAVLTKGFIETDRGPRLIVETLEDYLSYNFV